MSTTYDRKRPESLTRCQQKLDSPELKTMPQKSAENKRPETESALNNARSASAKVLGAF